MAIIYGYPDSDKPKRPQGSRGYRGKKGEEKVLEKFKELDDSYHVLCNVKINSYPFVIKANKAQIDFVVISKRGIFAIEVKNWCDEYYSKHKKYGYPSPHLQVDRAGYVLWKTLHFRPCNLENPPVTRVLLATFGNIPYDPQFNFVNVKNLNNINDFLQTKTEKLSDEKVQYVIEYLLRYVPNSKFDYRLKRL